MKRPQGEPYDVIVIGAGPAGSSAAIYTARADLSTLVIDKGVTAGAMGLTGKINNYPGVVGPLAGAEIVRTMRLQAESFGAEFIAQRVTGVHTAASPKEVFAGTQAFYGRTLILATGAMGRTQTIPGEGRLLGRGVSYCATCDGAFCRGLNVAVIGNHDEALEECLRLTTFAGKVYLVVPTPALRASPGLEKEAREHPKIELLLSTQVKEIVGERKVDGVRVQTRGGPKQVISVDGVFVYLQGNQPITDYLMGQIESMPDGCLSVDGEMQTRVPGVYAVGDLLCTHIKQAVIAAADGVKAAMAAERFLRGRDKHRPDWK